MYYNHTLLYLHCRVNVPLREKATMAVITQEEPHHADKQQRLWCHHSWRWSDGLLDCLSPDVSWSIATCMYCRERPNSEYSSSNYSMRIFAWWEQISPKNVYSSVHFQYLLWYQVKIGFVGTKFLPFFLYCWRVCWFRDLFHYQMVHSLIFPTYYLNIHFFYYLINTVTQIFSLHICLTTHVQLHKSKRLHCSDRCGHCNWWMTVSW